MTTKDMGARIRLRCHPEALARCWLSGRVLTVQCGECGRELRTFMLDSANGEEVHAGNSGADAADEEVEREGQEMLEQVLRAAYHALRSYEYGNASPILAASVADDLVRVAGTLGLQLRKPQ